jgi:hypothetical protein
MSENTPPLGMTEVSCEKFQQTIMQLNVHPYPQRDYTLWRLVNSQKVVGWSDCGYVPVYGKQERRYALPEYVN